jgi:stage V sporulation protein G
VDITEIRVTLRNEDKLRGFANVTFDNAFVVRGMKIIKGSSGYFVSMPSRKRPDGTHQDVAHPVNKDMRTLLEKKILEAYELELKTQGDDSRHGDDSD